MFLQKTCLFCADFSQDSKKVSYFLQTTIRNSQNCIKKCDVITFTRYFFFCHWTSKNKDIPLKFCINLDHKYSVFFDNWKISDFIGNYVSKIAILFLWGGQNKKCQASEISIFLERSIIRSLTFFDSVVLQNWTF